MPGKYLFSVKRCSAPNLAAGLSATGTFGDELERTKVGDFSLQLFASKLIFCGAYSPQQNPKEVHDTGANQLPTPLRFATLAFSMRNCDLG